MSKQALITRLFRDVDKSQKMSAIEELKGSLAEADVVLALCIVTLQTDSHELRTFIIDTLKSIADRVNPYYAHLAVNSENANLRKWALVNLSLMECRSAKTAVISGLKDSSHLVQQAAALNIGLYRDTDFLKEVERFFERNTPIPIIFDAPDPPPSLSDADPAQKNRR